MQCGACAPGLTRYTDTTSLPQKVDTDRVMYDGIGLSRRPVRTTVKPLTKLSLNKWTQRLRKIYSERPLWMICSAKSEKVYCKKTHRSACLTLSGDNLICHSLVNQSYPSELNLNLILTSEIKLKCQKKCHIFRRPDFWYGPHNESRHLGLGTLGTQDRKEITQEQIIHKDSKYGSSSTLLHILQAIYAYIIQSDKQHGSLNAFKYIHSLKMPCVKHSLCTVCGKAYTFSLLFLLSFQMPHDAGNIPYM